MILLQKERFRKKLCCKDFNNKILDSIFQGLNLTEWCLIQGNLWVVSSILDDDNNDDEHSYYNDNYLNVLRKK